MYCIVITTTAMMLPGVAPPGIDFTEASIAIVAVLSAAMVWVILVPVPLSAPVWASRMAIATCVAEPLFIK